MAVITIVRWGYKPTYNLGAPHCITKETSFSATRYRDQSVAVLFSPVFSNVKTQQDGFDRTWTPMECDVERWLNASARKDCYSPLCNSYPRIQCVIICQNLSLFVIVCSDFLMDDGYDIQQIHTTTDRQNWQCSKTRRESCKWHWVCWRLLTCFWCPPCFSPGHQDCSI